MMMHPGPTWSTNKNKEGEISLCFANLCS